MDHTHHHIHPAGTLLAGDERYRQVRRVTLLGAVIDLLLGAIKLAGGYVAQSQALIADGIHSLSDVATDAVILWAAKHGSREADESHPYGHGRIETLATVILGIALVAVAAAIMWDAAARLFHPDELLQPGILALVIAALSVALKEWIYRYTMRVARRLRSDMLKANAWHSRSDALSSVVVIIGVAGSMAGLAYLDAIAAAGVALMVGKIGWDLGWVALRELTDAALDRERVEAIQAEILKVDGVRELHLLRTRRIGGEALVDVHIIVDPRLSVSEGHYISETVRQQLVRYIDEVSDVLVHIDPEDDEEMAPSMDLPPRHVVLERLYRRWDGIPEVERAEQITLHYLAGKLVIEICLPFDTIADIAEAQALKRRLTEQVADIDEVAAVDVYFG